MSKVILKTGASTGEHLAVPSPFTDRQESRPRLQVRGLWKLYGPPSRLAEALALAEQGATLNEVRKQAGVLTAVRDVSFSVQADEIFVVMGLSGSGKSTLVRCLSRLVEPTAGHIEVDGEDITQFHETQLREFRRHKAAMVFQHYALFPHLNVIDNVAYALEIQGTNRADRYRRARETLHQVRLEGWEERFPRELSGGMQQRVGLARALAPDPEILFMDEPFSGLDPLIRVSMQKELLRLQRELRKTIVFITHDLNEAIKVGDRIAVMREGQIVQLGKPKDIVLAPADQYIAEFTRDVRRELVVTAAHLLEAPPVILPGEQSPELAASTLATQKLLSAPVVSKDGRYLGVLSTEQAQRGIDTRATRIADVVNTSAPTALPETTLEQFLPLLLRTDHPINVVERGGTLVGQVQRSAVANIMEAATENAGSSGAFFSVADLLPGSAALDRASRPVFTAKKPVLQRFAEQVRARQVWLSGLMAVALVLLVSLLVWGPGVAYPDDFSRPVSTGVDQAVDWATRAGAGLFDAITYVVARALTAWKQAFLWVPWPAFVLGMTLLAWRLAGRGVAVFVLVALVTAGFLGLWDSTMETLAITGTSVLLALAVGFPIGIAAARSNRVDTTLRPVLDAMQTLPPFVYLVPAIMFFGLGNVPAVIATVIVAAPPVIRLTNLGIRQVSLEVIEASRSLGSTNRQLLTGVQIPLALPSILAGINQTTVMSLGMVVLASLVGAGGLGKAVLTGLGRLSPGMSLIAGLGIVALTIMIDRMTQGLAGGRRKRMRAD